MKHATGRNGDLYKKRYFGAKTLFYTQFLGPYGPVCVLARMVTLRPCSLYTFCKLTLLSTNMQHVIICESVLMSLWYSWRGEGVLPYISHVGMCCPNGRVFVQFLPENGYRLCPFWSGIRYGFSRELWERMTYLSFQFQMI